MSFGLTTLFGAVGTVAAVLAVLLPVILAQGKSLRRELDHVRADVARVDGRIDRLSDDLHILNDRVARIEGALTGPWRPTNGRPTPPAPSTEASSIGAPL